jgi:hypothetical protein
MGLVPGVETSRRDVYDNGCGTNEERYPRTHSIGIMTSIPLRGTFFQEKGCSYFAVLAK